MPSLTSILSPHPDAIVAAETAPECFPDLHLDDIVAAVTAGHTDDGIDKSFYAPLHDLSTVEYRHQVFRDLDREQMRRPIQDFVTRMRTMRRRLDRTKHVWHYLQLQGWLVEAVQTYCDAVALVCDDLATSSQLLAGYASSPIL